MLSLREFYCEGIEPVTLTIDDGEIIGLSGDSGSGKTRLLRAIADLDLHHGGLSLGGDSWDSIPAHQWRKRVALLPSESLWWFDDIGSHFPNTSDDALSAGIDHLGLVDDVLTWESTRCSSGEKQRLSLLRILANQPQVLLLDEPTANLDAESAEKVEALIKKYITERGAVAIWVSHDHHQLDRVSERGLLIEKPDSYRAAKITDRAAKITDRAAKITDRAAKITDRAAKITEAGSDV